MGCRVFVTLSAVLGYRYQVIIGINNNGTDWHFTRITG
jgi:hypothetical protein